MKKDLIYIAIILATFLLGGIGFWNMEEKQWKMEGQLNDQKGIIEGYRQTMLPIYNSIDSLQILRNENDTTTYVFTADSLEQLFANRYSTPSN